MKQQKKKIAQNLSDGATTLNSKKGKIHCMSIIGQIEGHYLLQEGQKATKYEHIIPELISIEEDEKIRGLLIILNTMGGDVEAGLAIAELIASMKKPTVSLVLGGGHSIGVPLATAAKKSFIVPSATMTLHPVRINGLVLGAPQTFKYFEEMQITNMFKLAGDLTTALLLKADFAYYLDDSLKLIAGLDFQQDFTHNKNAFAFSIGFSCNPFFTDWKNLF